MRQCTVNHINNALKSILKFSIKSKKNYYYFIIRSDQESRAIEVCKLMSDVESVQMAIQYAAKIKR